MDDAFAWVYVYVGDIPLNPKHYCVGVWGFRVERLGVGQFPGLKGWRTYISLKS